MKAEKEILNDIVTNHLSVKETAEKNGVSVQTVYRVLYKHDINIVQLRQKYRGEMAVQMRKDRYTVRAIAKKLKVCELTVSELLKKNLPLLSASEVYNKVEQTVSTNSV